MKTISLGNHLQGSIFCLGTLRFGWTVSKERSYQILDYYVEAGGTFLDTANIYGKRGTERIGGLSENLLGEWMADRKNRDGLVIATKVGFDYTGTQAGLSSRQVIEECDKSLKRLQTDVIDLYYAHLDDRKTPLEETAEAFQRLIQSGKVKEIGASNFSAWRLAEARFISQFKGWTPYCCIQQRHTYLRPRLGTTFSPQVAANDELIDYCAASGAALLAYSPLLSGAYTRSDRSFAPQYAGPDSDARLAALHQVANEVGATPNQVVLAWMLQSTPPVIPLVTGSSLDQLKENFKAQDLHLSVEQVSLLNQAGQSETA